MTISNLTVTRTYASVLQLVVLWLLMTVTMPLTSAEWRDGPPLNTPRHGAAAVVLDGKIYVIGGATTNGIFLTSVERFDPLTGQWDATSVAPVPEALFNAAAVVFFHNHPSGVAEPSHADEAITRRLKDALALVDVRVLDHFVVSAGESVSFAERGLL